jgi:hypothetical protein
MATNSASSAASSTSDLRMDTPFLAADPRAIERGGTRFARFAYPRTPEANQALLALRAGG